MLEVSGNLSLFLFWITDTGIIKGRHLYIYSTVQLFNFLVFSFTVVGLNFSNLSAILILFYLYKYSNLLCITCIDDTNVI